MFKNQITTLGTSPLLLYSTLPSLELKFFLGRKIGKKVEAYNKVKPDLIVRPHIMLIYNNL